MVLVDSCHLPPGVDFPPLEANKYGWEQYPQLDGEDIAERCWRTDIVISLGTEISAAALEKMLKIGLLVVAGDAVKMLDRQAVADRKVTLVSLPDAQFGDMDKATASCEQISQIIDDYIREKS